MSTGTTITRWGAIALLLATSAVGCSKRLDTGKLQKSIEQALNKAGVSVDSVECGDKRKLKTGDTFTCTARSGADTIEVTVTQTDEEGNVNIEPHILVRTKLIKIVTDHMRSQGVGDVKLDCERSWWPSKPGAVYSCGVTSETGETGIIDITVKDEQGNVSWEIRSE